MKARVYSIQVMNDGGDQHCSTRYVITDDAGNDVNPPVRGVVDTVLSQALKDAVFSETQSIVDANFAVLAPAVSQPEALTVAMAKVGQAQKDEAATKERARQAEAASNDRLEAMAKQAEDLQKQIDEASARLAQASLTAEDDEVTKP